MLYALTGATGSFGSALTRHLLATTPHHLRLISRDEHKQAAMMREIPPSPRTTYILADIRDEERMRIALHDVDVLVHAAALKIVPVGEMHIVEMTKINVLGTMNIVNAAILNRVPKSLLISSDKSVSSVNSYGKSKALAESIFVQANAMGVSYGARFACVRGGNVWASRGSVVERWTSSSVISVTQPEATRFHLAMDYWLAFCLRSIAQMRGGEIFVPLCRAWQLETLAEAFLAEFPDKRYTNVGARFSDKTHECLISDYERTHTTALHWGYAIEPSEELRSVWDYESHDGASVGEALMSNKVKMLTKGELREMIHAMREAK